MRPGAPHLAPASVRAALPLLALVAAGGLLALSACGGDAPRPDVLLVVIDTCRADRTGLGGHRLPDGRSPTPHLDRLAAGATPLREGFSPVPLTLPAVCTVLSGLLPDGHGVRENDSFRVPGPAERGYTLLQEDLRAAGWRTAAFVSGQPLEGRCGLDAGFETYVGPDRNARRGTPQRFRERDARHTTEDVLAHLAGAPHEPLFLLVHYFDPHAPYVRRPASGPLPPGTEGAYVSEIAHVDAQVGRLLETFGARGRPRVVVVVADHGEGLGAHGEATHGHLVHDATIRVPFLLALPEGDERSVDPGRPPRLEDVRATILDVAGVPGGPPASRDGRSLVGPAGGPWRQRGETLYPWYQFRYARLRFLRDDRYKLVEGGGRRQLFDWRADPAETRDLAEELPDVADRLESELLEAAKRARPGRAAGVEPPAFSGPYMASRPPGTPDEPDEAANRELPHPEEGLPVIRALELARGMIRKGEPGRAFRLLDRHRDRRSRNPALLFWTARALQTMGREPGLGPGRRAGFYERAARLFREHDERFGDPRAADSLLRVLIESHRLAPDPEALEEVVRLVNAREARGTATWLAYASRAQAHEALGDPAAALRDFRAALALDPENRSLRADVARLEAR